MKTISIRELASYNKDLLTELPLTITKWNIPVAVILSIKEYEKVKNKEKNV